MIMDLIFYFLIYLKSRARSGPAPAFGASAGSDGGARFFVTC